MMSAIAQWMNLEGVEDDTHLNLISTGIEQNSVLFKLESRLLIYQSQKVMSMDKIDGNRYSTLLSRQFYHPIVSAFDTKTPIPFKNYFSRWTLHLQLSNLIDRYLFLFYNFLCHMYCAV